MIDHETIALDRELSAGIDWEARARALELDLTGWKAESRKWEARAKENNTAAEAAGNRLRESREFLTRLGDRMESTLAEIDRQAAEEGDNVQPAEKHAAITHKKQGAQND